jgi:hypothetical protein
MRPLIAERLISKEEARKEKQNTKKTIIIPSLPW